ncbi:aromatic aminotransferase [Lasallia pustulata]|uniref:Aromatic aminotransferase n=1 Tax=Lasallia pustulata TaxID=136370 RepID=A0A1W5DAH0_9LECA|nr:aromatic aminotransferase [Lasallia pustulata]
MAPPTAIDTNVQGVTDTQAIVMPDPLTTENVAGRRLKVPKMSLGVAAFASSDMWKTPYPSRPKAKRWDYRLSVESRSRMGSSLKAAAKYLKIPDLISLGGGLPSSENFPFERMDIKVPLPPHFSEQETKESGVVSTTGKYDVSEGKSLYDISLSFNYGQATGSGQLLRFVTEHTECTTLPTRIGNAA